MPQEITDYLKAQSLTDEQRADLWDAFYQNDSAESLTKALEAVDAPQAVKADLWDMKAGSGESEEPAAPGSGVGLSLTEMAKGAGKRLWRNAMDTAPYLDPMSVAAKVSRVAAPIPQTPVERLATAGAEAPAMQELPPGDPNAEAQRVGAIGGDVASLALGGRGAAPAARGVMARLPGMLRSPAALGGAAAGVQLARGKGIVDAADTGLTVGALTAGGKGLLGIARRNPGLMGRTARALGRFRGGAPRAVRGASPASPSPAPVRAAPMQSPPTAATPVAAPVVNPNAARLQQQQAALSRGAEASEFEMAGARPTLGRMPSARPAPKPAQSSASHPVGGSSVDGGTTAASAPKTPKIRPIPSKPKDPDGWQPIQPLSNKAEYEARLKAFRARLNQPLDPLTKKMAQDVIRLHQAGSSTPAKSPGQIAAYLSEHYGKQVARGENALSPHMARQFVDLVLKGAN